MSALKPLSRMGSPEPDSPSRAQHDPLIAFDRRQRSDRRRQRPQMTRAGQTVVRLHDYDLKSFSDVAAGFGSSDYAYVVTPNVDHLIRLCDDESFRDLYSQAGFVLNDSRFVSRMVRISKGLTLRVCTGSDLTAQLLSRVVKRDDCVVLIGGSAEQARQIAERYGLRSLRHLNPPMGFINDPAAVEEVLEFIEAQSPFRFCFLAVGCPRQEQLAQMLRERGVARGLALCVGASINYLTSTEKRAPVWVQNAGFEWAYRLLQDPKRMTRRYLIRGPRFFMLLMFMQFELLRPVLANKAEARETPAS
jgi:exopolysaccharide biosynthesis WecB/TagA/CpsF family protein